MAKTEYTKGEWKAWRFSKYHNWKVSTGNDNWFIDCGMDGEANAQLISAAPKLYEALVIIRQCLINSSKTPNILQTIGSCVQQALAKAEEKNV